MANNMETETVYTPLKPSANVNKKTSRAAELQRLLEYKLKFNVVEELIGLYPTLKPGDQRQVLADLMRYLYPQLKAMEIDNRDGEKICINVTFPDSVKPTKPVVESGEQATNG